MESPGPSDLEEKEADMEVEKFALPIFGDSPGPSPSVTPPTVPSSPRSEEPHIIRKEVRTSNFTCSTFNSFHVEQGLHRLEKYLNIQDCLEKSLKIKFALKSTWKTHRH